MAVWIRISKLKDSGIFFSSGGRTTTSHGVTLCATSRGLEFNFSKNWVGWHLRVTDMQINKWYHIIATWDSIHVHVYRNGCFVKRSGGGPWRTNDNSRNNNIYIGRSNKKLGNFANGFLDEMCILDYSLDGNDALIFYLSSFWIAIVTV